MQFRKLGLQPGRLTMAAEHAPGAAQGGVVAEYQQEIPICSKVDLLKR
jgi:hypothetical protein